jgi:hypothetical protein
MNKKLIHIFTIAFLYGSLSGGCAAMSDNEDWDAEKLSPRNLEQASTSKIFEINDDDEPKKTAQSLLEYFYLNADDYDLKCFFSRIGFNYNEIEDISKKAYNEKSWKDNKDILLKNYSTLMNKLEQLVKSK